MPASQLLGLFNRIMHKFHKLFSVLEESQEEAAMESLKEASEAVAQMRPVKESLEEELVRENLPSMIHKTDLYRYLSSLS